MTIIADSQLHRAVYNATLDHSHLKARDSLILISTHLDASYEKPRASVVLLMDMSVRDIRKWTYLFVNSFRNKQPPDLVDRHGSR